MPKAPKKSSLRKAQVVTRVAAGRGANTKPVVRTVGMAKEQRCERIVVRASLPTKAVEKRNIAEGRSALLRAKSALTRPGVQVFVKDGVPMFHADPKVPGLLVRTLNGATTRGRFVDGKFKPA